MMQLRKSPWPFPPFTMALAYGIANMPGGDMRTVAAITLLVDNYGCVAVCDVATRRARAIDPHTGRVIWDRSFWEDQ